jgi:hypothetical protein
MRKLVISVSLLFAITACTSNDVKQLFNMQDQHAKQVSVLAQPVSPKNQPQLIIPSDKPTTDAMKEAMPNIQNVLAIHMCIKDGESLRLMNQFAVAGVNMVNPSLFGNDFRFPNNLNFLKYHDINMCVNLRVLDQWVMPALNALQFRAVYFAEDSGEVINFEYLFKKVSDGSWKVFSFKSVS